MASIKQKTSDRTAVLFMAGQGKFSGFFFKIQIESVNKREIGIFRVKVRVSSLAESTVNYSGLQTNVAVKSVNKICGSNCSPKVICILVKSLPLCTEPELDNWKLLLVWGKERGRQELQVPLEERRSWCKERQRPGRPER